MKGERDKLKSLNERTKRDFKALCTISDRYNCMLRDVWNYRERTYLKDIEGKSMHAAIFHLKDWYALHEQYAKLTTTKH